MDLTVIRGLGPARREKLESAGVKTIDALARADIDDLSGKVGISVNMLDDFQEQADDLVTLLSIDGLGESNLAKLIEADVRTVGGLARSDVRELAEATGIAGDELTAWKRKATPLAAARKAEAKVREVGAGARRAGASARARIKDARVVLTEGITDARVKFDDDVLAEAKILPIRARDNVEQILERVKGNVVLLRERADTAVVRVEDKVYEGLPLFKEKVAEAGDRAAEEVREIRVRVQEIRDKRVLPEARRIGDRLKGLFKRDRSA